MLYHTGISDWLEEQFLARETSHALLNLAKISKAPEPIALPLPSILKNLTYNSLCTGPKRTIVRAVAGFRDVS